MFLLVLLVEVEIFEVHSLSEAHIDASNVLGRLRWSTFMSACRGEVARALSKLFFGGKSSL
jgi:hypothetical protein